MAFLKFNRKEAEESTNSFKTIAEGDYELFVKDGKWDPQVGNLDKCPYFNLELIIRTDVDQEFTGRKIFHSFYVPRDPDSAEKAMGFINRFNLALGIPDGVEFETQEQWLNFIIGKPVKAHVGHKEYKGKTYVEVKYFMESEYSEMSEQGQQTTSSSGLQQSSTKLDDDPFAPGSTIDISDDDLPF